MKIETDNITAEFKLSFDDTEVEVVLEFHFSENAEEFINPGMFANLAANAILQAIQSGE